ncbi:chromobox protein homolog 1-like [Lutzomyia longipalpis]|uniref:Putative heterochromatin protein 1 n=1 Tax=Lutzomyia longipalpis TaxID=7200 RepID=A0A7G3AJK4_LUTLO|nr:chromobox protein homolog 1-like [Lutzomyia longipalpis]
MGKKKRENVSSDSDEENEYQVESIRERRMKKGRVEYYIKWEGYPEEENTWEPIDNLDCPELIAEFEAARASSSKDEGKEKGEKETKESAQKTKHRKSSKRKADDDDSDDEGSKKSKRVISSDESDKEEEKEPKKSSEKSKTKKSSKTTNDDNHHRSKNGDTKDLVPETILGATDINGPLMFLVKWKGTEKAELIPAKEANLKFPQEVIAFYEQRLIWHSVKDKNNE